jgi:hypothetical protein
MMKCIHLPGRRLFGCCVFRAECEYILVVMLSFDDTELHLPSGEDAVFRVAYLVPRAACCNPSTSEHASDLVPIVQFGRSWASTCTTGTWNGSIGGDISIGGMRCQY